jgi:signal transduction histidine kinase
MTIKEKQFTEQFELSEMLLNTIPFVFCKDKNGVYRGCNLNQAKSLGFCHPSEFVGKTIFDILEDKDSAIVIDQTDRQIMQTGMPAVVEETITTASGTKTYLSQKQPIHCKEGNVVGLLGFAMDITEIKSKQLQAEAEREKFQKEIDHYKNLTQQHSKFQQIANQVAHDIVSPLSALSTIISMLKDIPEQHRITLKQAATRIEDITNDLLKHYRMPDTKNAEANKEMDVFFTYLGLREILSEKRVEYHALPITFTHSTGSGAHFAFIQVNSKSFRRMLSNLINNAVEALEGRAGNIQIKITETNNTVVLTIADNGKGMPLEVREKILGGVPVIDDKKKSHGIGLCQVRDTLQQSKATMDIESIVGSGTKIILTFPRSYAPHWAITKLTLRDNQTVLILDDDPFIHGAWDARFAKILAANPEMKVMHFTNGAELLEFLEPLDPAEKEKFYLLSDHELIDQEMHGLNVISQSKLNNATLVTSHYTNPNVLAFADELHIPILPKRLAPKIPIQIIPLNSTQHEQPQLRKADVILIDDSQVFADSIIFRLLHRKVVHYLDPRVFLAECEEYAKETPICIDNHFGVDIPFGGLEVAEQLHARGFKRLYIVSGAHFEESSLPAYVTLIKKLDLDLLDSL